MNERTLKRSEIDLTQPDAARKAGVSLSTWRRWEGDPSSVSPKTQAACAEVLEASSEDKSTLANSIAAFIEAWHDSPRLTPRQAYALAAELSFWADSYVQEWLRDPSEPLHKVDPFSRFDLRVMMLVGENRAWAEAVGERCHIIANEIESGVLPFDRPGPLIDEVLIGAALDGAQASLEDMPDLFAEIPAREAIDDDEHYLIGDTDWDIVADGFDDICQWDEWEIPLLSGHLLLPAILLERHPFTWFDRGEPSGPGYLQRLAGLVVDR